MGGPVLHLGSHKHLEEDGLGPHWPLRTQHTQHIEHSNCAFRQLLDVQAKLDVIVRVRDAQVGLADTRGQCRALELETVARTQVERLVDVELNVMLS